MSLAKDIRMNIYKTREISYYQHVLRMLPNARCRCGDMDLVMVEFNLAVELVCNVSTRTKVLI